MRGEGEKGEGTRGPPCPNPKERKMVGPRPSDPYVRRRICLTPRPVDPTKVENASNATKLGLG